MAEPLQGQRGTKYASATEGSLVRDVADRIALLQPDAAPLISFINGLKGKKEAINPYFEWFEDDIRPNVIVDTGGAGTGTTINVATGTGIRVLAGDTLVAPNGELIRVTSVATDALTVVRSYGDVAAYTLAANDQLVIAGRAAEEGAAIGDSIYTKKEVKGNHIQIFRDPVKITVTQAASESYGGDDRVYQRKKVGLEHKRSIEAAFLLGDSQTTPLSGSAEYIRTTRGAHNFISTNVTDVGGTLTEAEMETILRGVFRYQAQTGPQTKLFLCAPIFVSAMNFWAKNALQISQSEKTFGVRIATYRSGHGDLDIVRHWMLADFTTFTKYAFILDMSQIKYRFLRGLDTKLHLDVGLKSTEAYVDEYRTHAGLQMGLEKTHALIKNCTGFAP